MILPYQSISASTVMEQWIVCTSQWNGAVQGSPNVPTDAPQRHLIWWSCSALNSTSYAEASGCCLGNATLLPARSHSPFSHFRFWNPAHFSLVLAQATQSDRNRSCFYTSWSGNSWRIFCYCIKYIQILVFAEKQSQLKTKCSICLICSPAMTVWNNSKLASMTEVMDRWQRIPHSSKVPDTACNSCSKGFTVSTINMLQTVIAMKHNRKDHKRVLAQVAIIVASLWSSRKVRSFLKKRVNRRILPSRSARTTFIPLNGSSGTAALTTSSAIPLRITRMSRRTAQSVRMPKPPTARWRKNSKV